MKKETKINTQIIPHDCKIIGVLGEYMYIRDDEAYYEPETDNAPIDYISVVIKIKISQFNKILKNYINRKRQFCENWNEFCGVHEQSYPINLKEIGTINVIFFNDSLDFEDKNWIYYKDVPLIESSSWSEPDMEHG